MNVSLSCKDLGKYDLVVAGGGCTGLFAAVRAARSGLKVAIVEKSNCFGGVATNGLVNVWHTLYDIYGREQIIGGLTEEAENMLIRGGYADDSELVKVGLFFDPNALKAVLDDLAVQSGIRIFFHTFYQGLIRENDKITSVLVANKDGAGVLSADFFIDATGDGDLCRDAGLTAYTPETVQPASPCCFLTGNIRGDVGTLIREHGGEFGIGDDWGWSSPIPGLRDTKLRADFHLAGKKLNTADDLSNAEIEGRKKMYALLRLLRKYDDPAHSVPTVCAALGVRETVHFQTLFRATERDLLCGKEYEDTVMNGTYRVDIHHADGKGITFRSLDGRQDVFYGRQKPIRSDWRKEAGITAPPAPYYQIPFRILVQDRIRNLIPVGRMLNADEGAFGALRVMVNLNQLGEAAGAAAEIALRENKAVFDISGKAVQKELIKAGVIRHVKL